MAYEVYYDDFFESKKTHHGTYDTYDDAYRSIEEWWEKHDFEPHYTRSWTKGNVTTIDYGYHFGYYKIKEVTNETRGL